MDIISHNISGPRSRFKKQAQPVAIIDSIRADRPVTMTQATQFFDWLAYEAKASMVDYMRAHFGPLSFLFNIRTDDLFGYCTYLQSNTGVLMNDLELTMHPFCVRSLPGSRKLSHVALTMNINTDKGPSLWLLDPSFRQFCNPRHKQTLGIDTLPGEILKAQPDSQGLLNHLLIEGYIRLETGMAKRYLESFYPGQTLFDHEDDADAWLRDPPQHQFNMWYDASKLQRLRTRPA